MIGGDREVALVLAVGRVDDHHHPPGPDLRDRLFDGRECGLVDVGVGGKEGGERADRMAGHLEVDRSGVTRDRRGVDPARQGDDVAARERAGDGLAHELVEA